MHKHSVRAFLFQNALEPHQHITSHIKESLTGFHNSKVIIRANSKYTKNLIKHLTVLPRDCNHNLEIARTSFKLINKRAHFDCLWTRSEDKHDFLQNELPKAK